MLISYIHPHTLTPLKNKNSTLPVGLTPEMDARVRSASDAVSLPKNAFARMAIEAAVEAVESHEGELVIPIKFTVKKVPTLNPPEK